MNFSESLKRDPKLLQEVDSVINSAGEIAEEAVIKQVQERNKDKNYSSSDVSAAINDLLTGKRKGQFERDFRTRTIKQVI